MSTATFPTAEALTQAILQDAVNMGQVSDVQPGTVLEFPHPILTDIPDVIPAIDPDVPMYSEDGITPNPHNSIWEQGTDEENAAIIAANAADLAPKAFPEAAEDISSLVAKTVFLRVSYGLMGNTKQVPGAGVLDTDADKSRLRVSKTLLESKELEAIKSHDTSLRKWLKNMCLPFLDWPGVLVIPKAVVTKVQAKLKEHRSTRGPLVDAFVEAYPALVKTAQEDLQSLHNASDYPPVDEVKGEFTFSWTYKSFDTPDSLKEIDPELYAEQAAQAQAELTAVADEIGTVMRQALFDMVSHLKNKLTPSDDGKKKRLHETAVENLKEFLNTFDLRNVTNDKQLAEQVAKVRAIIGDTSVESLKSSDEFREKIRAQMESVTDSLGGMIEEKPTRKFRA